MADIYKNKRVIVIMTLYLSFYNLFCQNNWMVIDKINGLSNAMTNDIIQDKQGFLWIATWGGLNRYDGYNFKTYKSINGDTSTLTSNGVREIIEDNKGRLWVITNLGFNLYDRDNERFVRILMRNDDPQALISNDLFTMKLDSRGNLWLGSGSNGLCVFNVNNDINFTKEQPKFKQFKHDPKIPYSICDDNIKSIIEDMESNIWISTNNTKIIDRYNSQTGQFEHFQIHNKQINNFADYLKLWLQDTDSLYWGSAYGCGMFSWNKVTGSTQLFKVTQNENSISSNQVQQIRKDKNGIFWLSTDGGGICLFNRKTGHFDNFKYDITNPHSLGSDAAYKTFEDKTGVTWIATFNGGLNKLNNYKTIFHLYRPNPSNKNSLNHKSVLSFMEDQENNLWIGTDGGGINVLDLKTGKFNFYKNDLNNKNTINSNAIICLIENNDGRILIGTYGGGLNIFNKKNKKFYRYLNNHNDPYSVSNNDIWTLYKDSKGNIWLVTMQGTLNLFDINTGKFYKYRKNASDPASFNEIYTCSIFEDSRHLLWFATADGLEMINLNDYDFKKLPPPLKFKSYKHTNNSNSISSNNIITICEDKDNNMWFGTEDGRLNKLEMITQKFSVYTSNDGLKDIAIRGTVVDKDNNIWVTTVDGMWKFSIKNKTFRKFDESDGIQNMSFSRASLLLSNGQIVVGGINGFNAFYPNEVPYNIHKPNIVLTDFKVYNKSVKPGEKIFGKVILNKQINDLDEITISYKVNFFAFEFAALDFTNPEKNQYKYILEGFDNEWHSTNASNRVATYTNLSQGNYIFRVIASNNDGYWNKQGLRIKIKILPPWWETWWARTLFLILLITIIFIIYNIRVAIYIKHQKELTSLVKLRTSELEQKNIQLTERQAQIEEQSEELLSYSESLKQVNEILVNNQNLIEKQSEIMQKNNQQLSLLNSTKDKFFSIIAHDLRNPFNQVMGFSELILSKKGNLPQEKLNKYIDLIYTTSLNGNNLLENLLQWSRSQTGRISFEPAIIFPTIVAEEVITLLEGNAHSKNIKIQQFIEPNASVFADENMLKTILRNLISNAIKFTETNGLISIELAIKDNYSEITVSDNGVGIPKNNIDLLFRLDSNITTKGTSNESGTGLGLIICKEFVERHKGVIWVESEPGKGSKFKFTLPME